MADSPRIERCDLCVVGTGAAGGILAFDAICLFVFAGILGWI